MFAHCRSTARRLPQEDQGVRRMPMIIYGPVAALFIYTLYIFYRRQPSRWHIELGRCR